MAVLRVSLFQTLRLITPEGRPLDLGSPTTRSLFAYLLLNRSQPSDRRRLAFFFWPHGSESAARRNLRQYLHRIRRALEPVGSQGEWLLADGSEVQIDPSLPVWVDVDEFRQRTRPGASLVELEDAIALYSGDLLEDVYEDWCQELRQELREAYLGALERLSRELQQVGNLEAAIRYAQKWTAAEPLDEAAHRRLMTLYMLNGERSRAIQHYQGLADRLFQELGTEPMPETLSTYEAIQAGDLRRLAGYQPDTPAAPGLPAPVSGQARTALLRPVASQGQPAAPIIGRQDELARLQLLLKNARESHGRLVLITGEAGIGKTRLVHEYLALNPDIPTLQAACHELEAMHPFASLRPLVEQALAALPDSARQTAPAWLSLIAQLYPSLTASYSLPLAELPAPEDGIAPLNALASLFMEASPRPVASSSLSARPLQLVLDDLQWADTPSWNFLAHLARQASDQRLLVIGMCRLEDLPPERSRLIRSLERNNLLLHLPLQRLTPEQTAALAAHLLPGGALEPLFLRRLYQETEGNPFFIIEVAGVLREAGRPGGLVLESGALRSPAGLPLSIQRAIEARLDRLETDSHALLATAAAIGRAFTLTLLEEISQAPVEQAIHAIEEWTRRGLVSESSYGYDFSHDKIRQVAYNSLSRARRQYVHRRIAEVFENAVPPVDAATLAHHYARSDQPLKALPYLTQAGERALQARAYLDARQFGQQAVSLLGRMPGPGQRSERIDLNLQLAQAYAFTGDLERAREILAETEHLALVFGDEARLGRLFHRSSQIFWLQGQPEAAGDYARRTLRTAEELNDASLLWAALRMLGRVSIAISAFDDAIAYLVRYTRLEDSAAPPPDLSSVLGYLGVAYSRVGSWSRALESARRGVALAERLAAQAPALEGEATSQAVAFARMQLAFVHTDYHDWKNSLEILETIPHPLEQAEPGNFENEKDNPISMTPLGFMLLGLRGLALAHLGQPRQGIQAIRPALAWAERAGHRVFHYLPRMFLSQALLLAGEHASALAEIRLALEQARLGGNRWAVGVALRLLAEVQWRTPAPDWSQVENCLIESMQVLRQVRARPDLARTYLALRRLYDRAGQIAWAVDCHFRATSIFEELGMSEELRQAQGQAARDRRGAVVIPGLALKGPNVAETGSGAE
jgi:DNA-binding SARP family transcriptional activator